MVAQHIGIAVDSLLEKGCCSLAVTDGLVYYGLIRFVLGGINGGLQFGK